MAIRKVFAASVQSILGRLSKEFPPLVVLSNCTARPFYYCLDKTAACCRSFVSKIVGGIGPRNLDAVIACRDKGNEYSTERCS